MIKPVNFQVFSFELECGQMENRNRRLILEQIQDNPGSTFQGLMNDLVMSQGTLRYHLDILKKEERIIEKKIKNQRVYLARNECSKINKNFENTSKSNKEQKIVMELIHEYPGITRKELLERSRLSRRDLTLSLYELRKKGHISKVRESKREGFRIITRKKLHDEMMLLLIEKFVKEEIDEEELKEWKKKIDDMV